MANDQYRLQKSDIWFVFVLILLGTALWVPRLSGPIDLRWDAGVYYVLGTSLAEGQGFRLLNEPGDPVGVQYPPGLPAWVAAHQVVLGTSDPVVVGRWLRWTGCVISIGYTVLVYIFARGWLGPKLALLSGVLAALYFHSYFLSDLLFTEVPFGFISLLFLLALNRTPKWRWGLATTLLAWAAFLLRTAGVALLAAWVFDSLLRKQWRQGAIRAALAAVPFLLWQGHVYSVERSPDYHTPVYEYQRADYQFYNVSYAHNARLIDPFVPELGIATRGQLVSRVANNLAHAPIGLGESASGSLKVWTMAMEGVNKKYGVPVPPSGVAYGPILLLATLIFVGAWHAMRTRRWAVVLYVGFTTLLICLTPWPGQFARYFAPATPLLVILMMCGIVKCWTSITGFNASTIRLTCRGILVGCVASVLTMQLVSVLLCFRYHHQRVKVIYAGHEIQTNRFYYNGPWRSFDQAERWFRDHGDTSGVVATVVPHEWYLRLGMKAIMPPYRDDPAEAQRLLDDAGVTYLVVDTFDFVDVGQRYARPVVEAFPARWSLVFQTEAQDFLIYRRADESAEVSEGL